MEINSIQLTAHPAQALKQPRTANHPESPHTKPSNIILKNNRMAIETPMSGQVLTEADAKTVRTIKAENDNRNMFSGSCFRNTLLFDVIGNAY